jgi:serine/threonine protein kinase
MTAIPIHKAILNFEDEFMRESFNKVIQSLTQNQKHILPFLHFDIMQSMKLMIKIQKFNEYGSLKDQIWKTSCMDNYSKKYPTNSKGKPLHSSLISSYGRQILEGMAFLHSNKWYHIHLHTGNIFVDENQHIYIGEVENFVNNLPVKNEHYFNYAFEEFNSNQYYTQNKNDYNSKALSEIFKNNFNIYEKLDVISFGRVVYEMATGRELKSNCPDEMEYKTMDAEIVEILRMVFLKKVNKINNFVVLTVPEVSMKDLLKSKFFNPEGYKSYTANGDESNLIFNNNVVSNLNFDLKSNFDCDSKLVFEYDSYCSFIKENIFNQSEFIRNKMKTINNYLNAK